MLNLIIKNGDCFIDGKLKKKDIGIVDGKIAQIEDSIEESSKDVCPAMVGTPIQLPYPPIPLTTPRNKFLVFLCWGEPK